MTSYPENTLVFFNVRLDNIDFSPILFTLVQKQKGPHWQYNKAVKTVEEYKNFLRLNFSFPDKTIVPSEDVDFVWHTHILDTAKYTEDCEYLFGKYLHHFPYLGTRGAEDEKKLEKCYEDTIALISQEFGSKHGREAQDGVPVAAYCSVQTQQEERPVLRLRKAA